MAESVGLFRFFAIQLILMSVLALSGSKPVQTNSISKVAFKTEKFDRLRLVDVENATLAVVKLLQELNYPSHVKTMIYRPPPLPEDIDCPLSLCDHVNGVVLVPHRSNLFLVCLAGRQFCGLCPGGTTLQHDDHSFRCTPMLDQLKNKTDDCNVHELCQFDLRQRLRVQETGKQLEWFIICSKKRSFCGFCPERRATFNINTLTCDKLFPESKFLCPPNQSRIDVYPDPLTLCSPLAFVCLPGKRQGVAIPCTNPKMRHNQAYMKCDLPEHVPECGGQLQSSGNNATAEIESQFNVTKIELARGGPRVGTAANCMNNCIRYGKTSFPVCMRICSPF